MSLMRLVSVSCDVCHEESDAAGATGAEARAGARRERWKTGMPGGRDVCPGCLDRLREETS